MKITISGGIGEGKSILAVCLFEALQLFGYEVDIDEGSECDGHLTRIKDDRFRRSTVLDLLRFRLSPRAKVRSVHIFQETTENVGPLSDGSRPCDSCKHRVKGFPSAYKGNCIGCSGRALVGGMLITVGKPWSQYEVAEEQG